MKLLYADALQEMDPSIRICALCAETLMRTVFGAHLPDPWYFIRSKYKDGRPTLAFVCETPKHLQRVAQMQKASTDTPRTDCGHGYTL